MKRKATVCFALVVLLLVSVFSKSIFYGAADSSDASEFTGAQSIEDWWSMFHHDLTHTGNSQSTAPKTNQTLWRFNTGGPVDSPVVSDGVVYVGSLDNNVYALNASNGARVWSYATGGQIMLSSPAVADGAVYIGSEDHKVYALNATTGAFLWSYTTGDWVVSSPAVANGIVYVGSYDHLVYAFGPSPSAQTYSVAFTESGLPSGTSWNVTLNSQTKSSTSDSITFDVPNGVYAFSIMPPTGYTASPSSGSVTVKGENINEKIIFTPTIPKFPSLIVLSLFIMAILLVAGLLAVAIYRRKH